MICAAPPPDHRPRPARAPYRANDERPLWYVRATRSADDWARCDAGRRLDTDTSDLLLDHVFEQVATGEVEDGLACLVDGLAMICDSGERSCWRRFKRDKWSIHPLSALVWQPQIRAVIGRRAGGDRGFAALMSLVGPDFFMAIGASPRQSSTPLTDPAAPLAAPFSPAPMA